MTSDVEKFESHDDYLNKTAAKFGIKATAGMFSAAVGAGFSKSLQLTKGHRAFSASCRVETAVFKLETHPDVLRTLRGTSGWSDTLRSVTWLTALAFLFLRLYIASDFVLDLQELPLQYKYTPYSDFISKYGTHRVTAVTMGGERRRVRVMDDTKTSRANEKSIEASLQVFGGIEASVSKSSRRP